MQIRSIKNLLDKLEIIRLFQARNHSIESFNIFTILRSESDEVNLHSRFLYELLNPKGKHGMGSIFLRLFVDICELPVLRYEFTQVLREHSNIDILIKDNHSAIVIENKIYAIDQYEQLKRYHQYTARYSHEPTLLYLTLDGREPTNLSIGDLKEKVKLISYNKEISEWIKECIKESATQPALRETLLQYQSLITRLTNNNMDEEEKKEVLALIAQDNNVEQAAIIARNWNHVRWHTEWDFWTELEALAASTYAISLDGRFSEDAIHRMVHRSRGKNPYYGLSFCIGNLHGSNINLRVERSEGPIYYGFPYCSNDDIIRFDIKEALHLLVEDNSQSWAGFKYTSSSLDFENFNNSITLQLANPEKRKKIINNFWQEIQFFINDSIEIFQQKFGSNFELANK